ncbi:molybdate ABC transporter substrate-binding protein [soil metagenome]
MRCLGRFLGRPLSPLLALVLVAALAGAGCGSDDNDSSSKGGGDLVVSAAASLKTAFTSYGEGFTEAKAQFSFAASDELAAQIRKGAKPDVFASANTKLPDELFAEKLVEKPTAFASNRLVLAVPADSDKVRSLEDVAGDKVSVAIGAPAVPIGSYTRKVLAKLDAGTRKGILANVKTEEPDVAGISAKLQQGAADAGFLYFTDVEATNGKLKSIELPASLQPQVAYGLAIVKRTPNREAAQTFIDGLLKGAGADALREAGFKPPPQ